MFLLTKLSSTSESYNTLQGSDLEFCGRNRPFRVRNWGSWSQLPSNSYRGQTKSSLDKVNWIHRRFYRLLFHTLFLASFCPNLVTYLLLMLAPCQCSRYSWIFLYVFPLFPPFSLVLTWIAYVNTITNVFADQISVKFMTDCEEVTQSAAAEIDLSEYEIGDHGLSCHQTRIESPRRNLCSSLASLNSTNCFT